MNSESSDNPNPDLRGKESPIPRTPFHPPKPIKPPLKDDHDPCVYQEPWMYPVGLNADETDVDGPRINTSVSPDVHQSVWDEPGVSNQLAGDVPDDALTWYRWFLANSAVTTLFHSLLISIAIALVSGTLAVIGTLTYWFGIYNDVLIVTVFAPTVEEILKIALLLWVVERYPWLIKSGFQIVACGIAGGVAFAAIENLIYLNVYIANPTAEIIQWRWTICVLLHSTCSMIASFGVLRIWNQFQLNQRAPKVSDGAWLMALAIVLHGGYNAFALYLEFMGSF